MTITDKEPIALAYSLALDSFSVDQFCVGGEVLLRETDFSDEMCGFDLSEFTTECVNPKDRYNTKIRSGERTSLFESFIFSTYCSPIPLAIFRINLGPHFSTFTSTTTCPYL